MRTWFPEAYFMPDGAGQYRPTYRWYVEDSFTLVPGKLRFPTSTQARHAARDWMAAIMEKNMRSERAEPEPDVLGREQWLRDRAGRPARDQQDVLGGIIVKGRAVKVERKGRARA